MDVANRARSILVVEDDDQLRRFLDEVLDDAGYQVQQAENGQRALEILQDNAFDIVLTDLVMPGQDGIGLITALRRFNPDQPIIAMSGRSKTELEMDSLDMVKVLGANVTLQKPFSIEELEQALGQVLGQQ